MYNILQILNLFYLLALQGTIGCPILCNCKWKGGKEWVECADRGLQSLPQGAGEETQVLDLSDNKLLSLQADCFFSLKLVNLQRLYLSHSQIRNVATHAFTGLQGLVELDLSENNLEQLPSEIFASVKNLMRLNLAGNPLQFLHHDTFAYLDQLNFLDLSHCHLSKLEANVFSGLHALEWLRLNDNLLTSMPESSFPTATNLHGLSLHGNPWLCDCHLLALYKWLHKSQNQTPQESEPRCTEPIRLQTKIIRMLKIQELACIPILSLPEHLDIYESDNATLQCIIQALPQPATMWLLNGESIDQKYDIASHRKTRYIYNEHFSNDKIITTLEILDIDKLDDGTYVCQAENLAGISQSNLTLRVLPREHNTSLPPTENKEAGYAGAIAAGALFGTLLALSCLFFGIFVYARHLRLNSKNNSINLTCKNNLVPPCTLKRTKCHLSIKAHKAKGRSTFELSNAKVRNDKLEEIIGSCIDNDSTLPGLCRVTSYLQTHQTPLNHFIEPDLINEVTANGNSTNGRQQFDQPNAKTYSRFLDHDGYPLNFGLPKLGLAVTHESNGISKKILPLNYQHPQCIQSKLAAILPTNLSCDTNKSSTNEIYAYSTRPFFEISGGTVMPLPFLPTTKYCSETAYVSSSSDLYNTAQSAFTNASDILAYITNPEVTLHSLTEASKSLSVFEHPESSDEGYVGDAMDV